ncbi:MAG: sugar ABC transporter ATP-binding protein [Dermatophilaceae bacterium]
MTSGTGPVLEVVGVSKRFPGVLALDDVSVSFQAGRVHALVGENGAGKSTLIKVLTGVYAPDQGQLRLHGKPVHFTSPGEAQSAGISTIYQEVNLVPLMSVARNLFLGREPVTRWGLVDFPALYAASESLLREFGITVDVRAPLRTLGLGAQQMVALARAVSIEASVVIMDEPTSSLEASEVETLFGVVDVLRRRGVSIVYISHRIEELYRLCDDVTVLRDGRLVHHGALADLSRIELISLMLGRETGQVEASGRTTFTERRRVAEGEPALVATGLTRSPMLDGVSVSVRPGEVVGLGGLMGSGRSETAKAILGELAVDAGSVTVRGRRVRRHSPRAAVKLGIGMLPEDRKAEGIIPGLSVRDNIVLAAVPRISRGGLVSRADADRLVAGFMDKLRIKASGPDQLVSQLSGGNQQKVLLARLLCLDPSVLLLDEPTRGIDVGAKAEVQRLVDELADNGLGVMLISSDLEELVEGADRIVVLRAGSVVEELSGDQVQEDRLVAAMATSGLGTEERGDAR